MQTPVNWLLEGPTWVQYRTRLDLLGEAEDSPGVSTVRQAMLADASIQRMVRELSVWPGAAVTSHRPSEQLYYRLIFLADLGLKASDDGMQPVVAQVLAHISAQGPFQSLVSIPAHFGGSGQADYAWMLCDAPLLVYVLVKMGMAEDERIKKAVNYLAGLARENGWPCAASPEIGRFHGPGRREDPCPYATLIMLKLLGQVDALRDSPAAHQGTEALLGLWQQRRENRPYLFAMGSGFSKLKAPEFWYDILHVLDVLSHFPWATRDPRYQEMLCLVLEKASPEGRFVPESIYTAWKDWDFGQKKLPSRWLTLQVHRLKRNSKI